MRASAPLCRLQTARHTHQVNAYNEAEGGLGLAVCLGAESACRGVPPPPPLLLLLLLGLPMPPVPFLLADWILSLCGSAQCAMACGVLSLLGEGWGATSPSRVVSAGRKYVQRDRGREFGELAQVFMDYACAKHHSTAQYKGSNICLHHSYLSLPSSFLSLSPVSFFPSSSSSSSSFTQNLSPPLRPPAPPPLSNSNNLRALTHPRKAPCQASRRAGQLWGPVSIACKVLAPWCSAASGALLLLVQGLGQRQR
ncbi:hypothetical protein IWX46DRAFT_581473 [Phyllosticta citricarpa]|uniref:Uncharacterized protein n=1 Tax=Phyllosticta citricarpa TaxID=55181 RepID=A0ABR1MBR0_9PEZI